MTTTSVPTAPKPRRRWLQFSLRAMLLLPALVGALLASLWWWPKSQPLPVNEEFYRGYYPDGSLREEGECLVEFYGVDQNDPCPDNHDVRWGRYYLPDGRLGSEVRDGGGIQTYWLSNGTKIWELELKAFKRRCLTMWRTDGTLQIHQEYDHEGRPLPAPSRVCQSGR